MQLSNAYLVTYIKQIKLRVLRLGKYSATCTKEYV